MPWDLLVFEICQVMGWTLTDFDLQPADRVMRGYALWLEKERGMAKKREADQKAANAKGRHK